MADHAENTKQISIIWTFIKTLAFQVRGNGGEGHEQRIKKIEETCENRNNTCHGKKALKEYTNNLDRSRTWRLADIANIIQLIMLGVMIYGLFFMR